MRKNSFSTAYKCKSARLVIEQNYSYKDAAIEVRVHISTIGRWVAEYRAGKLGLPFKKTGQYYIQELEEKCAKLERKRVKLEGQVEVLCKALQASLALGVD